jgi:L-lysine 2,3-aminomutase
MALINVQYDRARAEALADNHPSVVYYYDHRYTGRYILRINQRCFHFYTVNRRRLADGGNKLGGGSNNQP